MDPARFSLPQKKEGMAERVCPFENSRAISHEVVPASEH
jgi:hypothetical protein